MTTENDHVSNLIARLLDKKRSYEQQIAEIDAAIHGLRATKNLLNGDSLPPIKPTPGERGSIVTRVRAWVMDRAPGVEIREPDIQKYMDAKPNAIRSALYKLTREEILTFEKGSGFHKKDRPQLGQHDDLVYDSSLPKGGYRE